MANNPFDQFDVAPGQNANANPFDQFDVAPSQAPQLVPVDHDPFSTHAPNLIADVAKSVALSGAPKGILDTLGLPADLGNLLGSPIDKAGQYVGNKLRELTGKQPLSPAALQNVEAAIQIPGGSTDLKNAVEKNITPFYQPQTAAGNFADKASEFATQNALTGGANGLLARALMGGAAGAGNEAAGQLYAGSSDEGTARLVGSLLPAVLTHGVPAAVRTAVRGMDPTTMQNNIAAFEAAGTTPTVGQATESPMWRATESLLAKVPGATGIITKKAASQGQEIGNALDQLSSQLSPNASAINAGRAIQKGITGDNGFVDQFKSTQNKLYNNLDNYIPSSTPVDVSNTKAAIQAVNTDVAGAPNISQYFQNSKIASLGKALDADTNNALSSYGGTADNALPYQALKQLRTAVGNQIANNSITSDVPTAQLKAIYGGISQDMQNAAAQQGSDAMQAWNRANTYTRAGMNRMDLLNGIVNKDIPEQTFQAAMSGTKEGATNIRTVMRSLPNQAQQSVSSAVIKRMGLANPGNQNDLGDAFNIKIFLTNWNKLSPEAKDALFVPHGPDFSKNMDQIAKVANNLKEGSEVYANPSGTASALANIGVAGSVGGAIASGNIPMIGAVLGGLGTANIAARALTNPNFVKWLAQNSNKPIGALPSAVNNLSQFAAKQKDQNLLDITNTLQQAQQPNSQ